MTDYHSYDYYAPIELEGNRVVPFVYVSAAIADYCVNLMCSHRTDSRDPGHRPTGPFLSDAFALINQVTQYAERQSYTVAELTSLEGTKALEAIADACAAQYLPGPVSDCGIPFNVPWRRVQMEAQARAAETATTLRKKRFYGSRDRRHDQNASE